MEFFIWCEERRERSLETTTFLLLTQRLRSQTTAAQPMRDPCHNHHHSTTAMAKRPGYTPSSSDGLKCRDQSRGRLTTRGETKRSRSCQH